MLVRHRPSFVMPDLIRHPSHRERSAPRRDGPRLKAGVTISPRLRETIHSVRMLDIVAENGDPVMLALFPHGKGRRGEVGVGEGADRNGDEAVELAVDRIVHGRSAVGAEMKGDRVAAVGGARFSRSRRSSPDRRGNGPARQRRCRCASGNRGNGRPRREPARRWRWRGAGRSGRRRCG